MVSNRLQCAAAILLFRLLITAINAKTQLGRGFQYALKNPELQIKKRRAVEDSNADNRMVSGPLLLHWAFVKSTLHYTAGFVAGP
jgi:hypothetical protein